MSRSRILGLDQHPLQAAWVDDDPAEPAPALQQELLPLDPDSL